MSFLINPYIYAGATIYDDANAIYSLRRPDMTTLWTNAVAKVRRSSDNAVVYLFFDGAGADATISTSSFISTTSQTTPDATTLATWLGANDMFYEDIYAITPDNTIDANKTLVQGTTALQPRGALSGTISTKNSLPLVDHVTGTRHMRSVFNSKLDPGNLFTVLSVSHQDTSTSNAVVWTSSSTSTSYIATRNDRRTQKRAMVQLDSGTTVNSDLTAQVDSSNQRLLTAIHNATNNILYNKTTLQTTTAHLSASYTNDRFQVGANAGGIAPFLDGGWQEIIIFDSDKTADISPIQSNIVTYYSIP